MRLESFTHQTITDAQSLDLQNLSQFASTLDDPAANNYEVDNWEQKNNTLLYTFYIKKRFDIFNMVYKDDQPVAFAGAYVFENTPIIGVRTFTHPDVRGGGHWCQARYILPAQINYYDTLGYEKVWLTFNKYNNRLVNFLKRMSEGKASHFGGGPKTIYQNLKWYDETKVIQYTDQIVAELDIASYNAIQST
jgi:hypothetical protein